MTDLIQLIDEETGLKKALIKPAENRLYDIDVSRYMRLGDNIFSEGTIAEILLSGTAGLVVDSLATDHAGVLQFRAHSGTDGARHKVTINFVTAAGDDLEADVVIEVKGDF